MGARGLVLGLAFATGLAHAEVSERRAQTSSGHAIELALIEGQSGPFADAGAAVRRNLEFAIEVINARGGVRLPDGSHPLALRVYDSHGQTEEALVLLRAATDAGARIVLEGNSSAVAGALVDAINKHNARFADTRVLFLNYSADDPALTGERCSFWHFRFDAHSQMRMNALTDLLAGDARVRRVYLIDQDYVFGRDVARTARELLLRKRPDVEIVGDTLHPLGSVKDFAPYVAKIRAAGADTVITGNWGSDLTLLVRAAREAGLNTRFYTFFGNSLGAPAALGEAGVGRVVAVAEWQPNSAGDASRRAVLAFRRRYPEPHDQYQILRLQVMLEMLAAAMEKAGSSDVTATARALEGLHYSNGFHEATLRADDHQLLQPLDVSVMEPSGSEGTAFDQEGSGYGFRTVRYQPTAATTPANQCRMVRP